MTDDEDIDWVQTEKHVFETASNHPFLVGLHSCFQTPSRYLDSIKLIRLITCGSLEGSSSSSSSSEEET